MTWSEDRSICHTRIAYAPGHGIWGFDDQRPLESVIEKIVQCFAIKVVIAEAECGLLYTDKLAELQATTLPGRGCARIHVAPIRHKPGGTKPEGMLDHRNGSSDRTVDRRRRVAHRGTAQPAWAFGPQLTGNHERRFTGFDDKIISVYAVDVSDDLISICYRPAPRSQFRYPQRLADHQRP